MTFKDKYNTSNGSVYKLTYHLVLCTKYRKKIINSDVLNDLKNVINNIFKKNKIEILEFDGEEDHLHMLIDCPPTINLAKIINVIKTVSSREINKKYKFDRKSYEKSNFWSPSYFVSSTRGAPLEILKEYIKSQKSPK